MGMWTSATRAGTLPAQPYLETPLGQTNTNRDRVAVAVTADGRRVPVRLPDDSIVEVTLLGILRLLGQGVLSLISGSRREPDGRRSVRR